MRICKFRKSYCTTAGHEIASKCQFYELKSWSRNCEQKISAKWLETSFEKSFESWVKFKNLAKFRRISPRLSSAVYWLSPSHQSWKLTQFSSYLWTASLQRIFTESEGHQSFYLQHSRNQHTCSFLFLASYAFQWRELISTSKGLQDPFLT